MYVFMLVLTQVTLWYKSLFEDVRIFAIYNGIWYDWHVYDSHIRSFTYAIIMEILPRKCHAALGKPNYYII